MLRILLTDEMWDRLKTVMQEKGCYDSQNNREIIAAILWK